MYKSPFRLHQSIPPDLHKNQYAAVLLFITIGTVDILLNSSGRIRVIDYDQMWQWRPCSKKTKYSTIPQPRIISCLCGSAWRRINCASQPDCNAIDRDLPVIRDAPLWKPQEHHKPARWWRRNEVELRCVGTAYVRISLMWFQRAD